MVTKRQLFAVMCARRVARAHPTAKATLAILERYLKGDATRTELDAAKLKAFSATPKANDAQFYALHAALSAVAVAIHIDAPESIVREEAILAAGHMADFPRAKAAREAEHQYQEQLHKRIFI
jgi:hypothetical protein